MTFNKMRFPNVWITFALCVILCSLDVHCGPVNSRQDVIIAIEEKDLVPQLSNLIRLARQYGDEDDSDEDDDEVDQTNYAPNQYEANDDDDDDDDEERSLQRSVREVSQKPVVEEETADESVIPSSDAPAVPEKKPSVLELLSSALDKAIEATSKIPTQQVATDAAGVFQILGQVFSEAIDKVIGTDDDGAEESTEIAPDSGDNKLPEEPPVLPLPSVQEQQPIKVEQEQEQEISQSDKETVNNL